MSEVEIEEAVSKLAEQAFEAAEFPYTFLEAFGNKANTIKRLRSTGKNTTNKAGVTCVILGIGRPRAVRTIFDDGVVQHVGTINPYLLPSSVEEVHTGNEPTSNLPRMHSNASTLAVASKTTLNVSKRCSRCTPK